MVHSIFINAVSQERLEGIFSYSAQMFDQQFLISSSLNPISRGQELPFSVLYCSGTVGGIVTVLYIWSDNKWVLCSNTEHLRQCRCLQLCQSTLTTHVNKT